MATELSIHASPTSFEANVQNVLHAQKLATCAALSHHFSMENSVEIAITPDGEWLFTVSCQMRNSDIGNYGDPDALVVHLALVNVPVENLVQAVEIVIGDARAAIDAAIE